LATTAWLVSSKAGARKPHSCQSRIGRAIASAARNATLKEVEKASSGLKVSGSGLRQTSTPVSGPGAQRTGSGRFSQPMIVARKI